MTTRKMLISTGGGDCPGLNTVIRAIVRSACSSATNWEIWGSKRAFNGLLDTPQDLVKLDLATVAGIQVKGGTILETSNKGNPIAFPVKQSDGSIIEIDRSQELIDKLNDLSIDVLVNIGGDGSQKISQHLYERGVNVIGVPKTIDNDLNATDFTFGFQTAVETATEAVDKLVSTAESHNRVMIAEVMGRDAGWICLYTAVAAGADVALIPEIPYDLDVVVKKINQRVQNGHGFAIILIAEGAKAKDGERVCRACSDYLYENPLLGGIGYQLMNDIKAKLDVEMRVTVLGHVQRGGTPIAFDRVLATQFGVKAFELAENKKYGQMVSYVGNKLVSVPLKKAVSNYKKISSNDFLLQSAKKIGICLGE